MADRLTKAQRSANMTRIRGKDTKPELLVRSLVHRMGYRFRLHRPDLPGTPDLVLPRHGKVIFVHGCFWHMHKCKRGQAAPATNRRFWREKREANRARDRRNVKDLRKQGWQVLIVWECWTRDLTALKSRLQRFLEQ